MPRILAVGLTGGIASGKTTVGEILVELGARRIDADRLGHAAIAPGGAAYEAVVARFGTGILDDQGSIDRNRLGEVVFADPDARAALDALVHPAVRDGAREAFRAAAREENARLVIYDAALLVETGAHRDLDRLVVVRCSPAVQLERLLERGLDPARAQARIDAQAPLEDKLAVADYVIRTDQSLDATRKETIEVHRRLLDDWRDLTGSEAL